MCVVVNVMNTSIVPVSCPQTYRHQRMTLNKTDIKASCFYKYFIVSQETTILVQHHISRQETTQSSNWWFTIENIHFIMSSGTSGWSSPHVAVEENKHEYTDWNSCRHQEQRNNNKHPSYTSSYNDNNLARLIIL